MDSKPKDRNLDVSLASRRAILVKLPKYLAERLESGRPLQEIGTIRICDETKVVKTVCFDITKELAENGNDKENIPMHHKFKMSPLIGQKISLFHENEQDNSISMKGIVLQKGNFCPNLSAAHLKVYRERIERSNKPLRQTILLDRAVTVYKPCSQKSLASKTVEPVKKFKKDKETVRNMLFELFGKHQYYRMKDLERLTQQPPNYLKEVMREMCLYNNKNPHQYMWELRPELRHYAKKNALKQNN